MSNQLKQFRQEVYQNFNNHKRTDTLMDLVDVLSSNTTAKTVVEVTLNPLFRRQYSALNKAVAIDSLSEPALARLAGQTFAPPERRKFYLLGTDVTSNPRPYAETLKDRGFVYQPNAIQGNKPIAIGHQYSFVGLLPEREPDKVGNWVIPLAMTRVGRQENKELVGAQQIAALLADKTLPFGQTLCVEVADSAYSKPVFLHHNRTKKNLVSLVRGTRTFSHVPTPECAAAAKGHPTWYGPSFCLKDPTTWGEPEETAQTTFVSRRQSAYRVEIRAWHNLLMHGKKSFPCTSTPSPWCKSAGMLRMARPCSRNPSGCSWWEPGEMN